MPLHKLWRVLPPASRRYGLAKLGAYFAPSITLNPPLDSTVIIGGEVSRASGLGEGARVMYQALQKHHISSYLLNVTPYSFSWGQYKKAYQVLSNNLYAPLILHINSPQIPYALLSLPRKLLKNRMIIGYWAWELEILPKDWEVGFQFVHEIWVPSKFVAKAIKNSTMHKGKTIRIIPHPIADHKVSLRKIKRAALGLPENKIIILVSFNLSSSFVRKNPIAAILAFLKARKHVKNIVLVLKITYAENYQRDMAKIVEMIHGNDDIIIIQKLLSNEENLALFHYADIVLSLHRSEGFGLVPAQAMLCGKPVIATDWSATAEFIDKTCGVPVQYHLIPALDDRSVYQFPGAYWADPICDIAASAINKLVSEPHYRLELGAVACKRAKELFNSDALMKGLSDIGVVTDKA